MATAKDLKAADLLNGRPGYSIFLGRFNGADVRYSGPSHIYVNGPTRSGKGVGFVLAERARMARLFDRLGHKARNVGRDRRGARGDGPKDFHVLAGFARVALLESVGPRVALAGARNGRHEHRAQFDRDAGDG